ncbi:MTH1187 family thiamine-binding protein [Paenibacillus ottowii]|uniref:MTH1187 family thiamine-binding protein n=1 Tax=Paenibacillus ottowii TaxID=2315729 RepID=A0ABY3B192_9BACL|nr:MTH1187 family thiamine-binding protein [Paenibacillus ottowii]NEU24703.1 MTH1187 family thiamine-binding protein [Paenibacillus polymyxa]TQR97457.1 MTH1187 family thiamine-binding protein [Paenibacillus ottowii]
MAIAEVTVIPIGTGSTSLSDYVAQMQKVLRIQKGITYELTSMSTIIEGSLDDVFTAIAALHEAPFLAGAKRVSTSVKIDDRRDKPSSSRQKLRSVAEKLSGATAGNVTELNPNPS